MNKLRFFVAVPLLAATFLAAPASAQTATNISIVSGNGQLTCPNCTLQGGSILNAFEPMQVRVTDANGNPVPNAPVNWAVVSGGGTFQNGLSTVQSFTDNNGNTNQYYSLLFNINTGSNSTPDIPSSVTASIANNATVTFYLTQALVSTQSTNNFPVLIQVQDLTPASFPPCTTCLNPGDTLTGNAGSTSAVQFKIQAYTSATGFGVPNISLRLVSGPTANAPMGSAFPTVSCATGAGADPGSVLTDQTGTATCTIILGSTTGIGTFYGLAGGVASSVANGGAPLGFFPTGMYNLKVLPGVAGMISVASGNNQSGTPGQPLATALQAIVGDSSGNPIAGQSVTWSVTPAGAATLANQTSTSDSSGHIQNTVTLTSSAAGAIQVKAALTSNTNISATFNITASVLVSGLQIVSGNLQSTAVNTAFPSPLIVQLATSNGTSTANLPVSFAITGPGTLSATSATTSSTGQAQVNVTAGTTPGQISVTATSGGFSQTFSLTVVPTGPTLTAGSFYNGADFQQGSISPCSIATIKAAGLAPAIQGAVAYDGVGGLPYLLAGDSVTVGGAQAPIYNVANLNGQQQLTFQVPCSVTPGSTAVAVNVGGATASVTVTVLPASPGLFTTQVSTTSSVPVLERPDGTFVSPNNPGRRGETLIAYVTGLGPTTPAVATNSLPVPGSSANVQGIVIVGISSNGSASGETPSSAALTQDIVGVYLVAFQVPSSVPSGSTVGFSVGVLPQGGNTVYYSVLGSFPVQ